MAGEDRAGEVVPAGHLSTLALAALRPILGHYGARALSTERPQHRLDGLGYRQLSGCGHDASLSLVFLGLISGFVALRQPHRRTMATAGIIMSGAPSPSSQRECPCSIRSSPRRVRAWRPCTVRKTKTSANSKRSQLFVSPRSSPRAGARSPVNHGTCSLDPLLRQVFTELEITIPLSQFRGGGKRFGIC
jgi:hypothetical protein